MRNRVLYSDLRFLERVVLEILNAIVLAPVNGDIFVCLFKVVIPLVRQGKAFKRRTEAAEGTCTFDAFFKPFFGFTIGLFFDESLHRSVIVDLFVAWKRDQILLLDEIFIIQDDPFFRNVVIVLCIDVCRIDCLDDFLKFYLHDRPFL